MNAPPPAPVMSQQPNQPVPTTMHPTPLLSPVEHSPPPPALSSSAPMQPPPFQAPPVVASSVPPPHDQPVPLAFPSQTRPVEQVMPVVSGDAATGPPPEPLMPSTQPTPEPLIQPVQPVELAAPVPEPLVSSPINAHPPISEPIPLFSKNNGLEHPPESDDKMEESSDQDGGQMPADESIESVEMDEGDGKGEEIGIGDGGEGDEEKKESNDDDMQLDSPSASEEENIIAETTEPNQT